MSTSERSEWDPADWDVVDVVTSDPEDTAERDGPATDLDDLPADLPEDTNLDLVPRHVEETVPWQEYNRPAPE